MKYFNSSETLRMCDVHVSENGKIEVVTSSLYSSELERLGKPEKTIRGRVRMEKQNFVFEPYAEASRRPTIDNTLRIGNTAVQTTERLFKLTVTLPKTMSQHMLRAVIEDEVKEIIARWDEVYNAVFFAKGGAA